MPDPDNRPPHYDRMQELWPEIQAWTPDERSSLGLALVHLALIDAGSSSIDLTLNDPVAGYPVYVIASRGPAVEHLQAAAGFFAGLTGGVGRVVKRGEAPSVLAFAGDAPGPSTFDLQEIEAIVGGKHHHFSAHLMRLVKKADFEQRERLRRVYPHGASA